jgi:hypothetical protein
MAEPPDRRLYLHVMAVSGSSPGIAIHTPSGDSGYPALSRASNQFLTSAIACQFYWSALSQERLFT